MNNDILNTTQETDQQLVISYELLYLLRWLIENEEKTLKNLVSKALSSGLRQEIHSLDNGTQSLQNLEDIQQSMVDFFAMFEAILLETLHEQEVQNTLEKNMMPAIDHIDSTVCDDATVRFSLEKVASKMRTNPQANAQELLFKELLRRWKPNNKKKASN